MNDNTCFVIGPIGKKDSQIWNDALSRYTSIFSVSAKLNMLDIVRADQILEPGTIYNQIVNNIYNSKLVIADLWPVQDSQYPNSNVMYELAVRHSFGLPVISFMKESQALPFDIIGHRAVSWDGQETSVRETIIRLSDTIKAVLTTDNRKIRGPVYDALGLNASFDSQYISPSLNYDFNLTQNFIDAIVISDSGTRASKFDIEKIYSAILLTKQENMRYITDKETINKTFFEYYRFHAIPKFNAIESTIYKVMLTFVIPEYSEIIPLSDFEKAIKADMKYWIDND